MSTTSQARARPPTEVSRATLGGPPTRVDPPPPLRQLPDALLLLTTRPPFSGTGIFIGNVDTGRPGRPLADDAILLKASARCAAGLARCGAGEAQEYRRRFYSTLERLMAEESPPGNWGAYTPSTGARGSIHPRQSYWWGLPFIDAYQDTKDERYLAVANRSAAWLIRAQRTDGGVFRHTTFDFVTSTFGQATSGSACAAVRHAATEPF
jgi:hypothetical protein